MFIEIEDRLLPVTRTQLMSFSKKALLLAAADAGIYPASPRMKKADLVERMFASGRIYFDATLAVKTA